MKKIYILLVVISILIIWVLSCCRITGRYIRNYGTGTDTLNILSNHKYVRISYPNGPNSSKHYIDTGTWEKSDGAITFRDWIGRNDEYSSQEEGPYILGADIHRNFFTGSIKLMLDYDKDYYYQKKW